MPVLSPETEDALQRASQATVAVTLRSQQSGVARSDLPDYDNLVKGICAELAAIVEATERQTQKQLGQLRPANTTAAALYSPASGKSAVVRAIYVANTSSDDAKFRVFHDADGSTYDQTTALYWDLEVGPGKTALLSDLAGGWLVANPGNLAVRTDTGNALTFTAYGQAL